MSDPVDSKPSADLKPTAAVTPSVDSLPTAVPPPPARSLLGQVRVVPAEDDDVMSDSSEDAPPPSEETRAASPGPGTAAFGTPEDLAVRYAGMINGFTGLVIQPPAPPSASPPVTSEIHRPIGRPSVGEQGRVISLRANFFELQLRDDAALVFQYHVMITYGNLRRLDRDDHRFLFWSMVEAHPHELGNPFGVAYDGGLLMYTTRRAGGSGMCLQKELKLPSDVKPQPCELKIQFAATINLRDLTSPTLRLDGSISPPVQLLDIVIRQALTCPFTPQAANFYPWQSSVFKLPLAGVEQPGFLSLGGGKELWPGMFMAAHLGEGFRPLLNVDVTSTCFYKPRVNGVELLCEVLKEHSGNSPRAAQMYDPNTLSSTYRLSSGELRVFNDAVQKLRVRVKHKDVRTFTVLSARVSSNETFFDDTDRPGEKQNVAEYFGRRYGSLRFPALPCLHVGSPSRQIFIPLELCELAHPQKYVRKLTDQQTAAIIRNASRDAEWREGAIRQMAYDALFSQPDRFLEEFGLRVGQQLVETSGRVLQTPLLNVGTRSGAPREIRPVNGQWSEQEPFLLPATCNSYAMIVFGQNNLEEDLKNFCTRLQQTATSLGVKLPPFPHVVRYGQFGEIPALFDGLRAAYEEAKQNCDLVLLVMPGRNGDVYNAIKEQADTLHGVMSQCVLLKNVRRPTPSTLCNLLMKINVKLGGVNSQLAADAVVSKYLVEQPCLVLGIDVTHPAQGEERLGMPSIAAVVGNIDLKTQLFGANVKASFNPLVSFPNCFHSQVQRRCRESVVYVNEAVAERLRAFHDATGQLPARILVFRDGVSNGQFSEVLREEFNGIRSACRLLQPDYQPLITYVVVQKRHHVRFFCSNPGDRCGRAKNIPPGTVVDRSVCSPDAFDFFLCSHFGLQGTSRPSRYTVLWDDSKFTADEIQSIAYSLCYTYGRCSRAVSIPTPVYYADLVAGRARCYVKKRLLDHAHETARARKQGGPQHSGANAVPVGRADAAGDRLDYVDAVDRMTRDFVFVSDSIRDRMYWV
ncbi:Piwi domain protein [Aphelenchoides fujianensis]|nr:Piwi domain protein [Aphelenchoides fujianensis]